MSTLGWPGTWGAVAALMLAGCGGATSGPGPADTSDGADSADLVAEDAGSDAGPDLAPDPLHDPSLPGPFEVGVTTVTWYDADRDRSLLVDIWYPAIPEAGAAPHAYPLALAEDVVLGELPSGLGVVEDAAADLSGAPYPVVLFSHGNNGMRFQNLFQGEHLASHGYVFVAPDHTGNLVIDSVLGQDPWLTEHLPVVRPADISFALDELLRESDGDGPLAGMADGARVGVTGHSYGGYTALVLGGAGLNLGAMREPCAGDPTAFGCELASEFPAEQAFADLRDPRVLAVAPLTPGFFEVIGEPGVGLLAVPVMVGGATADLTTPFEVEHLPVFEAAPGARYLLKIEAAGHFSYSVMCDVLDALEPDVAQAFAYATGDGCSPENVSDEVVKEATNTYVTAFFERHVRGDERAAQWLDAGPGAHAAVELLADP